MHGEACGGGQGLDSGYRGAAGCGEVPQHGRVWGPGSRAISHGSGSRAISCAGH